ncbi:MAG TPA: TetR/AcrR family transcriptional regulator [Acidimicrobiia bacterium]
MAKVPHATKKASTKVSTEASSRADDGEIKATRRKRGEPRRLLLEAARELFSSQGYSGTSTREIAERAGVSETLMFRYFGSKVGLFREALVAPFVEFVEDFNTKWQAGNNDDLDVEDLSRAFIGDLFDLFRKNRGLVVMLWAADAQSGSELAEAGVFDEINDELRVLVEIGTAEAVRRQGKALGRQDLATRSTLAMTAGMAVFGESFYGKKAPARKDIVEELTQAVLHGHLHRQS